MQSFIFHILFFAVSGLWFAQPLAAQIKLHANGKTTFGPIPIALPADRVVIDGGNDRALLLKVSHSINWWQSASASVSRQLTANWVIRYNGSDRFFVLGNGDLYARGGWYYSDSTLKDKLAAIENPVERLRKLRGVTFSYKPEPPCRNCDLPTDEPSMLGRRYGLIAQEVEQVFPEMVQEDNNRLKLLAYEQLIPVLVEAIKEQQAQIDALKLEIKELKQDR